MNLKAMPKSKHDMSGAEIRFVRGLALCCVLLYHSERVKILLKRNLLLCIMTIKQSKLQHSFRLQGTVLFSLPPHGHIAPS